MSEYNSRRVRPNLTPAQKGLLLLRGVARGYASNDAHAIIKAEHDIAVGDYLLTQLPILEPALRRLLDNPESAEAMHFAELLNQVSLEAVTDLEFDLKHLEEVQQLEQPPRGLDII